MKPRTIDSVCFTLHTLINSSSQTDAVKQDISSALEKIRAGCALEALDNLLQVRDRSALSDQNNTAYVVATEEIAFWMIYRAKNLSAIAEISTHVSIWNKGRIKEAIKEKERSLRNLAS